MAERETASTPHEGEITGSDAPDASTGNSVVSFDFPLVTRDTLSASDPGRLVKAR